MSTKPLRYMKSFCRALAHDPQFLAKVLYRARHKVRSVVERGVLSPERAQLSDRAFVGALRGGWKSPEAFAEHVRRRQTPRFFIDPDTRAETADLFGSWLPEGAARIVDSADRVCDHVFDLLGSGPVNLGPEIDWQVDFRGGWRWPLDHHSRVQYMDLDQPYDVKVPWELGRFQHVVTLGQAYWLTGQARYASEFGVQIESWLASCPPGFGVQWTSTMEVAIRAVNWIWGLYFFRDAPELDPKSWARFLKGLLSHGRHIWRNLEWGLVTHNHYLSNLVGLVYLGAMFPEFREAGRWLRRGVRGLEREILTQVRPDGVDFESSTSYHRLVTEMVLSAALLCRKTGVTLAPHVSSILGKMVDYTASYTQPDGTAPLIGDQDNGRLHKLAAPDPAREHVDHCHLLGVGALVLEQDWRLAAEDEALQDAFWLAGGRSVPVQSPLAARRLSGNLESRSFPQGGVYVLRDGMLHMTVDAGSNGMGGVGGHAHNDVQSFTLYAYDKPFIVDPGSFTYTADYRWRNRFRSTKAHNVVEVDGQEMQRFGERDLFQLAADARPKVLSWTSTPSYDLLDTVHYGYERLADPVTHRRQVFFSKAVELWLIRDLLTAHDEHDYVFYLHFPALGVSRVSGVAPVVATHCEQGANLAVVPLVTESVSLQIQEDWVSPSYGLKVRAPVVCYSWRARGSCSFLIALVPLSGTETVDSAAATDRIDHARRAMNSVLQEDGL